MIDKLILKPRVPMTVAVAVAAALASGAIALYSLSRSQLVAQSSPELTDKVSASAIRAVTALGRLEPQGEVIQLSAPTSDQRARVNQLLVQEGDRIRSGQVVAILDNRDRLVVALKQAKQQVKVAQAHLAQVKAGAKTGQLAAQQAAIVRLDAESRGEIVAQQATIARLAAELSNAQTEFQRYQQLYQNGAISATNIDSKRLSVETIRQQLNEAKANLERMQQTGHEQTKEATATLNSMAEVRPVDVVSAQAEVDSAITAVEQAEVNLDLAHVRAPRDGQILKIHTHPGELVSEQGIVDLGQTDQMNVVAEVYETDIGKVRLGQRATITCDAFPGSLQGTVSQIGLQINKKDVLNTDPAADVDARVVEVKIRLSPEDSKRVASLTRLQVKVAIDTNSLADYN